MIGFDGVTQADQVRPGAGPCAATGSDEAGGNAVRQVYPDPDTARVQTRIAYGHPAQTLVEASKEAALLVVGSRGHGAFTGMLLGSVSIHCVTGAFCPVTVVRHS